MTVSKRAPARFFIWAASLTESDAHHPRHREEQSDEAIHLSTRSKPTMDCRVGLRPPRNDEDVFEMLALVKAGRTNIACHREERSDEAIHRSTRSTPGMDCRVGPAGLLAMTRFILMDYGAINC